ncbi:MAG: hypothetical protein CME04_21735 [Gemmatimonadaceae bacterium]|jgi:4-hydroxy-tetrahydrodipicolinate synthase|nr:hypothetical protein [Gemmatimonadaceae bacterium]
MMEDTRMRGLFGLLPTPYDDDLEIHTEDLCRAAQFCCDTGQHGIVWPVMVGEFYFLGETERVANLDAVLERVNGKLPVVFGCSGVSVPQVCFFARAAQAAGAGSIIAMAPARTNQAVAIDMYKRMADCFEGPIMVQNAGGYAPLKGDQIAALIEDVPSIEYVKEERQPGPRHITETAVAAGDRIKTIFGGAAGKNLPDEMRRGADGCMPACEFGDVLARVTELWWAGDEESARALHRRILPLINLENHSLVRYVLRRRGVLTSTGERSPGPGLDAEDKREISSLLGVLEEGDFDGDYPFGQE